MRSPPSVFAFSIICSDVSYVPMRYVVATEPAGLGVPVVSGRFPGLPIVVNAMLNVLAPLPNVSLQARTGKLLATRVVRRMANKLVVFISRPIAEVHAKCCDRYNHRHCG